MNFDNHTNNGRAVKNYREYDKVFIGDSDKARLILEGEDKVEFLNFGEDNGYYAYLVDDKAFIGHHYNKAHEFKNWMYIHDDQGITEKLSAKKIIVYRAGEMGCIIQLIR